MNNRDWEQTSLKIHYAKDYRDEKQGDDGTGLSLIILVFVLLIMLWM